MIRNALAFTIVVTIFGVANGQTRAELDQGTQVFRVILHRLGMQPITSFDDAFQEPKSTLIVLHGRTDSIENYCNNGLLRQFVFEGGGLFVANDQKNSDFMGNEFGVFTAGPLLQCTESNMEFAYRGTILGCPLLQPVPQHSDSDHIDLLKNLKRVATNRPSLLRGYQNVPGRAIRRQSIAYSPNDCAMRSQEELLPRADPQEIAQVAEFGNGRLFVIADHSIFINSMLLQTDNDNIAFTVNIINWLTEKDKRTRVLFVDEGLIRDDFNINLDYLDPPLPHPDVLVPLVDKLIVALEQDDFFNQTLLRNVPLHRILRGMLLSLTVLIAAIVLYRITASKWRREPQAARLPDRVESLADGNPTEVQFPPPTPFEIGSAAQELAYSTFHDLLGNDINLAPVVYATSRLARRTWTRRVQVYWQIAAGKTGRTMSAASLKSLARRLADLRRAVERGDIRLLPAEEAA